MNKLIGYLLDRVTMYRLVVYVLLGLLGIAAFFGYVGILAYSPLSIAFSTLLLVSVCWITNKIMTNVFEVPSNVESLYITALILALIVSPVKSLADLPFLIWVGVLSLSSKHVLAIKRKHVFNPAAVAVVLTSLAGIGSASWWVGTAWMMPFVLLGSYLIVRKLQFEDMIWSYVSVAIIGSLAFTLWQGGDVIRTLQQISLSSPLFFLGGIMLTEPMTLPPTKGLRMVFGVIVGFLSIPFIQLGSLTFTPELALLVGNIFAYLVSSKQKLFLTLQQKIQASPDIVDFIFSPKEKFTYVPGQYMEWTLPHPHTDSRGNRRYFTLASSPTEQNIRLGVKFYPNGSTFKKALWNLDTTTPVVGAQLAGDFTLPRNPKQKLVFIGGGIGITPYRSMIKYLVDSQQKRDIVLFYTNRTADEIVYQDVFDGAQRELGIKTIYTLTKIDAIPTEWTGKRGRIDANMLMTEVPDFKERVFYLSGPYSMVTAVEEVLKEMGIPDKQIKKDFFPGLV